MRSHTLGTGNSVSRAQNDESSADGDYQGLSRFQRSETLIIATLTDIENTIYMR